MKKVTLMMLGFAILIPTSTFALTAANPINISGPTSAVNPGVAFTVTWKSNILFKNCTASASGHGWSIAGFSFNRSAISGSESVTITPDVDQTAGGSVVLNLACNNSLLGTMRKDFVISVNAPVIATANTVVTAPSLVVTGPTAAVSAGDPFTLSWTSAGMSADSTCRIVNIPSSDLWNVSNFTNSNLSTSGSQEIIINTTFTSATASINGSVDFYVSCGNNSNGYQNGKVTVNVKKQAMAISTPTPSLNITGPSAVVSAGSPFNISWIGVEMGADDTCTGIATPSSNLWTVSNFKTTNLPISGSQRVTINTINGDLNQTVSGSVDFKITCGNVNKNILVSVERRAAVISSVLSTSTNTTVEPVISTTRPTSTTPVASFGPCSQPKVYSTNSVFDVDGGSTAPIEGVNQPTGPNYRFWSYNTAHNISFSYAGFDCAVIRSGIQTTSAAAINPETVPVSSVIVSLAHPTSGYEVVLNDSYASTTFDPTSINNVSTIIGTPISSKVPLSGRAKISKYINQSIFNASTTNDTRIKQAFQGNMTRLKICPAYDNVSAMERRTAPRGIVPHRLLAVPGSVCVYTPVFQLVDPNAGSGDGLPSGQFCTVGQCVCYNGVITRCGGTASQAASCPAIAGCLRPSISLKDRLLALVRILPSSQKWLQLIWK